VLPSLAAAEATGEAAIDAAGAEASADAAGADAGADASAEAAGADASADAAGALAGAVVSVAADAAGALAGALEADAAGALAGAVDADAAGALAGADAFGDGVALGLQASTSRAVAPSAAAHFRMCMRVYSSSRETNPGTVRNAPVPAVGYIARQPPSCANRGC
jgi:SWI/SNF-related matrix-associated actin-dependent regulator 1 of chromatin subfamily A